MENKLEKFKSQLEKMGYTPGYYEDEDGVCCDQLNCIVDGMSFVIGPDDEVDAIWFSIMFEPNEPISDDECNKILDLFEKTNTAFDNLEFAEDDTVHALLCKDTSLCTEELLDSVIADMKNPDGALQYLKSISYVWED